MTKEYIKRESVHNALDDLSNERLMGNDNDTFISLAEAHDRIEEIPSEDIIPVRCKNCIYYKESAVLPPSKFCYRFIGYHFSPDDFCSYGVNATNKE